MKRILISLLSVVIAVVALHSQTINFSSVKVKTKTEKEKRVYEFPYDQFVMLNYGGVNLPDRSGGGNVLGIQYGQVHIGGWYVSADVSLSRLHFGCSPYTAVNYSYYPFEVSFNGDNVRPHFVDGKASFNRVSFGGGGIVRMVIPLYFYLGLGYFYQNLTAETEEFGWVELEKGYDKYYSPHSSGYLELGLQGNVKGFTMRTGFRYNFNGDIEISAGLGWTFGRNNKKSNAKND